MKLKWYLCSVSPINIFRWIEAWDRKRRQYLCDGPYDCIATRDDVRFATCPSYDNRTLSDVSFNFNFVYIIET